MATALRRSRYAYPKIGSLGYLVEECRDTVHAKLIVGATNLGNFLRSLEVSSLVRRPRLKADDTRQPNATDRLWPGLALVH